ncbi:hypothetical protein QG37_04415 [Candidozyma auris]|uniref:Uncharacterized protein n=1 Tax=Candidozyma auris TaxID=498019 RepID=A0A0L0NWI8_CANAR|nr:hypothetical protein QG37_04415 [[Candida] auris]
MFLYVETFMLYFDFSAYRVWVDGQILITTLNFIIFYQRRETAKTFKDTLEIMRN